MQQKHRKKSIAKNNSNIDCVIRYDPQRDTIEDLTLNVLKHIFLYRLKYNKPVILGVFGKSGEGKSESTASLIEELMKIQKLDLEKNFDVINAFTPLQYSTKLNKIMFDKEYKDIQSIIIHEAREVVKAKNWHSFVNIAISDINAMARSVKRVMTVIISQGLMDIDKGMRSTLTHYAKIERPNNPQLNAKMFLRIVYEDDTQMERPILKRRKPRILLIYPDGKPRTWIPSYIEIPRASLHVRKMLAEKDNEAKAPLIKRKLNKLEEEMQKELGDVEEESKLKKLINFYSSTDERLNQIIIKKSGKWVIDNGYKEALGLDNKEIKQFKKELLNKVKEKKLLGDKENEH